MIGGPINLNHRCLSGCVAVLAQFSTVDFIEIAFIKNMMHSDGATPSRFSKLRGFLNLKVLLVVSASLSLVLLFVSIFVDTYISTHTGYPVTFDRLNAEVILPRSKIGVTKIAVTLPPEEQKSFRYSELASSAESSKARAIDDVSIETFLSTNLENALGFRLPITSIEYASAAGSLVLTLEALSVCFTGLAIIFQLVFGESPDSFILRPGISSKVSVIRKDMLRSGLPGFCLLVSACLSMIHAVVISSYTHNMAFRIVAFSIANSGVGGGSLASFRVSLKGATVSAKQEQLKLMQFIGKYLSDSKSVSFGFSFYAVLASIGLNLFVLFALYYNDNLAARVKTTPATDDSQWNQLPWHCRVRPLWISFLAFVVGLGVTAVGGNVARRRGVKMNRHPFEVEGAHQSFIDDVVISHTTDYFFSTAGIVDGAVMIFMPLLVMVAISSLDRVRFASKVLELLGIIFFMRGISVMSTIMPTLFNVLQHPQCWDSPGTSFSDMIAEKEFCNDLMFSGHTVFCFLPALIFVFSIVHGPYSYKPALIAAVLISAAALTSLIIVGRLHYTSDVVIAITITALLVVMNAPVWKLQFSFRKSQLGLGSVSAIDKVPGYLELCLERLNLYTITMRETVIGQEEGNHKESWDKVHSSYSKLGDLINQVVADSKQAAMLEDDIDMNPAQHIEEIVVSAEDEKQPLLNHV